MNVEIEFLEWVHPRAGITKVQMEDGKPLVLKAKIKHEWVGLTVDQIAAIAEWQLSAQRPLIDVIKAVEQALKEKNT